TPTPPPSAAARASMPPSPEAPGTPWGWSACLGGAAVAFGPEVLLWAGARGMDVPAGTAQAATARSAALLAVSSLLVYGWQTFAAWLCSLRLPGNRPADWGLRRPTVAYFWTIPLALAGVYVLNFLYSLIVSSGEQDIIGQFPRSAAGIALFVLVAVVMAPLFEEVFFRGFLFRGLANSWGWAWGAVLSAAVFGLAHPQVDVFVPLFALGLVLAWVYKRTGSLWTSITLHALFNAISVLAWALTG
ncbi:MAG: CPBP family intramembrane glutamic endopeptidase, partial [Thermoleophilia bacterium]